jgi:1-acyl-sn-glycerol-3-phosphate acyltransferase
LHFIAKVELWRGWFLDWYLTAIGTIPVERGSGGREAIDRAVELVKGGGCLGIFPEGTRSTTGELGRGRSGSIVIASQTRAPLLPVYIEGSYESLPTGAKKVRRQPMSIYTGEPFELTDEQCDITDRKRLRESADFLMRKIAAAREKYVGAGENPD